jgi:hypothetical protein
VLGQVDLTHSARTQQSQDSVPGEHLTDPQHARMLSAAIDVPDDFRSRGDAVELRARQCVEHASTMGSRWRVPRQALPIPKSLQQSGFSHLQ